jgi:hypothetical protein
VSVPPIPSPRGRCDLRQPWLRRTNRSLLSGTQTQGALPGVPKTHQRWSYPPIPTTIWAAVATAGGRRGVGAPKPIPKGPLRPPTAVVAAHKPLPAIWHPDSIWPALEEACGRADSRKPPRQIRHCITLDGRGRRFRWGPRECGNRPPFSTAANTTLDLSPSPAGQARALA